MRPDLKGRAAAFLLGLLTFLALLEIALRLLGATQRVALDPPRRQPGDYVVLCLGDSHTYGNGAPPDKSYPRQLEDLLNKAGGGRRFVILNAGVPGHNTAQILADLPAQLAAVRPDLVILLAGMANSWNLKGYHARRRGPSWGAAVLDGLYRVRVFKLAKLLALDLLRRPEAAATGPGQRPRQEGVPGPKGEREKMRRANILLEECMALREAGAFAEAAERCRRAVALDPRDKNAHGCLGLSLKYAGRHREAIRAFMRGVETDPDSRDQLNYANYGELVGLYFSGGDPAARREIAEFLEKLATARGGDSLAREMLEMVRDGNFRHRESISAWIADDLGRIIALCRREGAQVMMQSYPRNHGIMNREVAGSLSVPFVDHTVVFSPLLARGREEEYMAPDGHCNARGYGLMAEGLRRKMAELGMLGPQSP